MTVPTQPSSYSTTVNSVNTLPDNPSSVSANPQVKIEQNGFLYINNVQMSIKFGGKEVDVSKMSQEQKDCLVKFWQELATAKPEAFKNFEFIQASTLKSGGSKVGLITKPAGDELQSLAVTINHTSITAFENLFEVFKNIFKSDVSTENTDAGPQQIPSPPTPPPPLLSNANEIRSVPPAKARGDINFKMAKLQTELQSGLRDAGFIQDSETDVKGLIRETFKNPAKMDELNKLLAKVPDDVKTLCASLLEEIKSETQVFEDSLRLQKESLSSEIDTLKQEIASNSSPEKLAQLDKLNKRIANLEKKQEVFTMQDFKINVEQPKETQRAAITKEEFNKQETKLGYEGKIPKDPTKETKSSADEPDKTTTQNPPQQIFAAGPQNGNASVKDPIFQRSSLEPQPIDIQIEGDQVAKSNPSDEGGADLGLPKQTAAPQQSVRQERSEAPSERTSFKTTSHPTQEQVFTDVSDNDIVTKDPIGLNNVMRKVSNFNETVAREATRFQMDKGKNTEGETASTPIPLSEELREQAIDLGNNLLKVIQRAESFEVTDQDIQQTLTSSLGKEQILEQDKQTAESQNLAYTTPPRQTILNLINLNQHIQSAISSGFISPLLHETLSKMHNQAVSLQTSQGKTESESSSFGPVSKSSGEDGNQGGSSGQGGQGQQQGQEKKGELSFPKMDAKEADKKLEALSSGQSIIYSATENSEITVATKLDNGAIEQQTFTPSEKGYLKTLTTHTKGDGTTLKVHHFRKKSTNGTSLMGANMPPINSEAEFNNIARSA